VAIDDGPLGSSWDDEVFVEMNLLRSDIEQFQRIERKFNVDTATGDGVGGVLSGMSGWQPEHRHAWTLSLYLDTAQHLLLHNSIQGVEPVLHLRLRWYAPEDPPYVDHKERRGRKVDKWRVQLSQDLCFELVRGTTDACLELAEILQWKGAPLTPRFWVRYHRQAWNGPNRARLTVDSSIVAQRWRPDVVDIQHLMNGDEHNWEPLVSGQVVEMKSSNEDNLELLDALGVGSLFSFSKFRAAGELLDLVGSSR